MLSVWVQDSRATQVSWSIQAPKSCTCTVSTSAPHGIREVESPVRRWVTPPSHQTGPEPSPECRLAYTHSPAPLARDVSSDTGTLSDTTLGPPPAQTAETGGPAPLVHDRLYAARAVRVSEQRASGLPQWSPYASTMYILHEALYPDLSVLPQDTFTRALVWYLRRRHRFRRPRKVRRSSRPIQDRISRDERLAGGTDRTVPGHWEGGLLGIGSHAKDAVTVRQAFTCTLRTGSAQLRHSLLYDQGPEMRGPVSSRNRRRCGCLTSIGIDG